jgi:stress-induced morphogen
MRLNKTQLNRLIKKIRGLLDKEFASRYPNSMIRVSPGYADNIHILIVAESFQGQPFVQRDDVVWAILEAGLTPKEIVHISLCLLLAPDEVPAAFAG